MFSEIVIPKDNEAEFIEVALKLGIKKIYFLYDFGEYNEEKTKKKLDEIKDNKDICMEIGFIVNQKNISKAIGKSKFLAAKSSEHDRIFIEGQKIRLIFGFEEISKKDFLHQRASGLNHIMCDLLRRNNVTVGFSYSSLFNKKNQALLIGRMMQNIALCRKYNAKTVIGSFSEKPFDLRPRHDIDSLFSLLGMNKN